jgi:site-specific DNA recombinase
MRLLVVTRLSKKTDESESPARQLKACRKYAEDKGHLIIGEAEDAESVSGNIAPWDRPKLGPWLRNRSDEFDGLIVDRPNRLGRNTLHFLQLAEQFKEQNKVLISVKPKFDFSTADGRKRARDAVSDAEYQREEIAEQVKRSIVERRDMGLYWGGPIPYGVKKVKLSKDVGFGNWGYEIDEDAKEVITSMAEMYLDGDSLRGIAFKLNQRHIPSPREKQWCPETVRIVLKSPAITGLMVGENGEAHTDEFEELVPMLGEKGPIDPIIPFDQWELIKAKLKANAHKGPQANAASKLYGIGICANDGRPLISMSQESKYGKIYRYLKCARKIRPVNGDGCDNPVIHAELVEDKLNETIMDELGDAPVIQTIEHKGNDFKAEIAQIDHSIEKLEEQMEEGNLSAERFASMVSRFEQRKAKYQSESKPGRIERKKLDITYGQMWEDMTPEEKQEFLVRYQVKAIVHRPSKDRDSRVEIDLGELKADQSEYV